LVFNSIVQRQAGDPDQNDVAWIEEFIIIEMPTFEKSSEYIEAKNVSKTYREILNPFQDPGSTAAN
jgi:hypothetical protein